MLDIEKRDNIEQSVLATFLEYPGIGIHLLESLNKDCFTSEPRQKLFLYLLKEKSEGREFDLIMLEEELIPIVKSLYGNGKSNIVNINNYINLLIEEYNLSKLYRTGEIIQSMVTNDKNVEAIIRFTENALTTVERSFDEHHVNVKTVRHKIRDGIIENKKYLIGVNLFDEYATIRPRNITIIAGNEGSFKTKFMIFIIRKLLKRYSDEISIQWFSMEDPADKLLRAFAAQDTFITDDEQLNIGNKYEALIPKEFDNYDIEFITRSATIKEIGMEFRVFQKRREDKFCILIIDNLMKIIPMDKHVDENKEIVREMESWNIKTGDRKASVFALHHFTKQGVDPKNKHEAYKPYIGYMKGNGIYKDAATQIILVNALMRFKDVTQPLSSFSDLTRRIFIVDVAKNKNNEGVIKRFMAYPEYNLFPQLD